MSDEAKGETSLLNTNRGREKIIFFVQLYRKIYGKIKEPQDFYKNLQMAMRSITEIIFMETTIS